MPFSHYNILLAEDDPDDQYLFSEALGSLSIKQKPIVVADGVDLIAYLREASILPDLIFLDINMPIMDGLSALAEIRTNNRWQEIPVIMLSTTASPVSIDKAWELGAARYATKPSGFEPFVGLLQAILSQNVCGMLRRERESFVLYE